MRHLQDIAALLDALQKSTKFHALVIQSPPGWAKSTTVNRILTEKGLSFRTMGSYSTPLSLFNTLCDASENFVLIDDCAGIFNEPTALAVLKAATWPSTLSGERTIKWSSTSEKVTHQESKVVSKLILLTNTLPNGDEMRSFLSRTLFLKISFSPEEVKSMLMEAASSEIYFPNLQCAQEVAEFLKTQIDFCGTSNINLRTLQLAYELAQSLPTNWKDLMIKLLPEPQPEALARELSQSGESVETQAREFCAKTGLSRRTFFNYRRLGPTTQLDVPTLASHDRRDVVHPALPFGKCDRRNPNSLPDLGNDQCPKSGVVESC